MVTAFLIIDYVRVATGFLLAMVVGWGHAHKWEIEKPYYRNNVGAIFVCILSTLFFCVVQQSEACSRCITASSEDEHTLIDDVRRMLGGSSCALKFTDDAIFKIPENYCKFQLQKTCNPQPLGTIYAERCFVAACDSPVHGVSFRFLYGISCMCVNIAVCLVLLFMERSVVADVQMVDAKGNVKPLGRSQLKEIAERNEANEAATAQLVQAEAIVGEITENPAGTGEEGASAVTPMTPAEVAHMDFDLTRYPRPDGILRQRPGTSKRTIPLSF
jgi:hypothetical protein